MSRVTVSPDAPSAICSTYHFPPSLFTCTTHQSLYFPTNPVLFLFIPHYPSLFPIPAIYLPICPNSSQSYHIFPISPDPFWSLPPYTDPTLPITIHYHPFLSATFCFLSLLPLPTSLCHSFNPISHCFPSLAMSLSLPIHPYLSLTFPILLNPPYLFLSLPIPS